MESDGLSGCLFIIAAVLLKAFYSSCEAAVTEISDAKVKSFETGTEKEKRLFRLLKKPARLLGAFSVNRIFSAVFIAYMALVCCLGPLERLIGGGTYKHGSSPGIMIVSMLIILVAVVIVLTVFCDGLPKRLITQKNCEAFAVVCVPAIRLMLVLLTPITALSSLLIGVIAKLFGSSASSGGDVVTEEEILMMVDAGNETGVIEESQKEMINNVFSFDDIPVSDIMTHRTDIVGVEKGAHISDVVNAAISSGFSRIPVYENTIDHIDGIIYVKDLLCMVGSSASTEAKVRDFMRDVIYIPETVSCGELFKQLTENKMQLAVVVDEYGGTAGIVTMEDAVESIVGNIQDEYDNETEELVEISDGVYTIDGTAEPEHILEKLGIKLPEDNGFDTVSGFIVSLLGRIPEKNETPSVRYENVLFTVLITEDMCITKVKAEIIENETKGEYQE